MPAETDAALADLCDELDAPAAEAARKEAKELQDRGGFGGPKKDGPPPRKN